MHEHSDRLLEDLVEFEKYVKTNVAKRSNILRKLIEDSINEIEEHTTSKQIIKGEITYEE